MLSRLLELLREGGSRRIEELAQELGTTPQLIDLMLEDLSRMGYVKPIEVECRDACARCLAGDRCAAGWPSTDVRIGRVWTLLRKGEPRSR